MAEPNPWKDAPPSLPPRREDDDVNDLPPAYAVSSAAQRSQPQMTGITQSPHVPSSPIPFPISDKTSSAIPPSPVPTNVPYTQITPRKQVTMQQPSVLPQTELARAFPGIASINLSAYAPPGAVVSPDGGVITVTDQTLCNSPQALTQWINEQILLPPIPKVRIRGSNDFDLSLNMLRYFLPQEGEPKLGYAAVSTTPGVAKGKQRSGLPVGSSDPTTWAKAFCADKSESKVLVINRRLMNWDSDVISGRTHALFSSLSYQGNLQVSFPVKNGRTELRMGESSLINTFKNVFTGKSDKLYEIDVFWPYATHPPGEHGDGAGGNLRKCILRTEEGWFNDWKLAITEAALAKRRGKVGLDDLLDIVTSPPRGQRVIHPWGGGPYGG